MNLALLILLLLSSFTFSQVQGQEQSPDLATQSDSSKENQPRQYVLANGLKIILLVDKAYPYICCSSWYRVGSRDDPSRMTGLTHLVEHLLFQNIGSFQGNQLANEIVRNGGEFSGFTSEDFTAFYANLPANQLELAIRGEAARMREAHFAKADVQKEISQLVHESESEDEDLNTTLNKEVHALAYEQHPYRNPPGGWHYELEHLTYEQAKAHYDRYFQPNNACLVLAGGFEEQSTMKIIEKYFAALPKVNNYPVSLYPQERPQLAERQIKLKAHSSKESVMVAYKVPGIDDADAPVFTILEQLLNAQLHGRLHSKLIESGLCTTAQAYFELKHDPGLFIIKCSGIPVNGSTKVVQALDGSLAQLTTKLLADTDISQAIKQTEFAYYCDGNGPYAAAFQAGFFESLTNGNQSFNWPQRLHQVTAAQILQAAKHYFNDNNRTLGELVVASGNNSKPQTGENQPNSSMHMRLAAYQDNINSPAIITPAASSQTNKKSEHNQTVAGAITHKVLDNGMNVIVLESHLQPLVYIYGAVKAGSVYDRPDSPGLAKLMTTIFNGGNIVSSKQQSAAEQNDLGLPPQAMLKFHCRLENILFTTHCLSSDLAPQLHRLFTTLAQPRIQASDFESQKNDLLVSLKLSEKNTEERIKRAILMSLVASNCAYYPAHPEQEINSISALKITDVQNFYRTHINSANTTLVIAGDIEAKEVFGLLDELTHTWSDTAKPQNTSPPVSQPVLQSTPPAISPPTPQLVVSNRRTFKSSILLPQGTQSQVILGRIIPVSGIRQAQAAWVALHLADCVLSSHPIFSRLGEQFETQPELLAETDDKPWSTKIIKLANNLIWSMQINLKPSTSSSAAVTAIQNELDQFSQAGLATEDLAEARRYLAGNIATRECFNLDKLTHFLLHGFNELNEIDLLTRTEKIMMALSSNDINQFISHMFKPQNAAVVVAGPGQLIKQVHPTREAAEPD